MTSYPKFVDLFGWVTVYLAIALACVGIGGVSAVLYAASPANQARADEMLHKTYYVVHVHWTAAIPFGLCVLLASGIGFLGYSMTERAVTSRKSTEVEP